MNETNFDWDDLRLFLAVSEHGGLAGAAAESGKSAPTLGRRMLALERKLGQQLFDRLPRGYELTSDGKALLLVAQHIQQSIDPIVSDAASDVTPRVKVSAGTWTTYLLCKHVKDIIANESIRLQFIAADHVLDIPHREAVIGIRNQRPEHLSLAGQRIGKVSFSIYAKSNDINTWAQVLNETPSAHWVRDNSTSESAIEVSHPRYALDLALEGAVKSVLPTFIGDAEEGLMRVSNEIPALEHMQWLVTHHDDRHLPEVRGVIDRLHTLLA